MSLDVKLHVHMHTKHASQDFSLNVAFTVEQGEVLGLLGPSGCGKSITLKCIAGIIQPDEGRVYLEKRVLTDTKQGILVPPRLRKVGYLFPSYALFPHMQVLQNVKSGIRRKEGEMHRAWTRRSDQSAAWYLQLLHIEELAARYPHQLSGGQQQRVALARLLASEPEAILLDEPFSALDASLKQEIETDLKAALKCCNRPVILVSHDPEEVRRYCNRRVHLEAGRMMENGEPFDPRSDDSRNLEEKQRIVGRGDHHQMIEFGRDRHL
ncbi:MAG: sulfate/molybdate ABC transporter ATP-binding protein [Sphaerochaeta sp.]|jgi:ABC-type sulfate/molybdate transport systems ATPase subunit|uniref:sulfate/molybdate ABC transporter ATP-binding protein n=1 Tax=Sphaerochaeta sp. TaxID=1972642 RepID=UPI002FC9F075